MSKDESLTSKVRSGVLWNVAGQVAQYIMRVGFSIILARLLTPREFGLVGMVSVFTGFAGLFINMGLGTAIIQRRVLHLQYLSNALLLSLLSACVLFLLFFFSSDAIATVYNEPVLKPMVQVLSCQFLLSVTPVVHGALLRREMRFKVLALTETCAFLAGSVVAVVAACLGAGVWSLVYNSLTYAAVSMLLLWWYSGWQPRLGIDVSAIRDLWSYSKHLVGFDALNYWARNADNYLIGKYCGAAEVGAYNRAYQLMLVSSQQITGIVSGVLFPAMSQLQGEVPRFREVLLKSHRIIAFFAFPLSAGASVLAEPLVLVLFGPEWKETTPLIRVLAWAGLGQSLSTLGLVFNSLGRPDLTFKVGSVNSVILIVSFLAGLPWGALGVAVAYTLAWWLLVFPFGWDMAARLLGLRFWHVLWNVREILACTILMAAAAAGTQYSLRAFPPIIQLGCAVATGAVVYCGTVLWLAKRTYREVMGLIKGNR